MNSGSVWGSPQSRTGSIDGISTPLLPDPSKQPIELIQQAVQCGQKILTQYDIWLPSQTAPDPTTSQMITVFNNTIYKFKTEVFPIGMNQPQNKDRDLFSVPLVAQTVDVNAYTYTVRMDEAYTIRLESCRDRNGRISGPFVSDRAVARIFSGAGSFRIKQDSQGSGYVIVPDSTTAEPLKDVIVIRSDVQGVIFNVGLYKNNTLVKDYLFDPLARKLEFYLPETYCLGIYIWNHRCKDYELCWKGTVQTGQIAFIYKDCHQKVGVYTYGNNDLIVIPDFNTIQRVQEAYQLDEDASG